MSRRSNVAPASRLAIVPWGAEPRPVSLAIAASLAGSRGYVPSFRAGLANHCPACGHGAFHVGRVTAECGACLTPLPIADARNTRKD